MSECVICFESYGDANKPACYPCGHVFCLTCIRGLKKVGCPTCHRRPSRPGRSNLDYVTPLFLDFTGGSTAGAADLKRQIKTHRDKLEASKDEAVALRTQLDIYKDAWKAERNASAKKTRDMDAQLKAKQDEVDRLKQNAERVLPAVKMAGDFLQTFATEFERGVHPTMPRPRSPQELIGLRDNTQSSPPIKVSSRPRNSAALADPQGRRPRFQVDAMNAEAGPSSTRRKRSSDPSYPSDDGGFWEAFDRRGVQKKLKLN